jgi:hypothetical protein
MAVFSMVTSFAVRSVSNDAMSYIGEESELSS